MSAHLRSIEQHCQVCGKRASVELRNTWNAPIGIFCKPHGTKALRQQLDLEDRR